MTAPYLKVPGELSSSIRAAWQNLRVRGKEVSEVCRKQALGSRSLLVLHRKKEQVSLKQQFSSFLTPGPSFVEDNFSTEGGLVVWG